MRRAGRARALRALAVLLLGVAVVAPARASAGVDPAAKCQSRQLKAASKLCKAVLRCQAKGAKNVAFDAASCGTNAAGRFAAAYGRALSKAAAAGVTCGLSDDAGSVAGEVRSPAETLAADVLAGLAPAFKADAAFRSKLLKAAGAYCGNSFKGWSKHAVKGSLAKLGDGAARARAKWVRTTEKAIDKVRGQGVDYTGLAPAHVGVRVDALVGPLVGASAPEPEIAELFASTVLSEPLLVQMRTTAGDLVEYFGDKNPADGSPTRLRFIRSENARGETITFEIDDQARPARFFLPDGSILSLEWLSDTELVVEATSADGEFRTYLPADLASGTSTSSASRSPARLPRAANSSIVTVSACGEPVSDALVEVGLWAPNGESRSVVATPLGDGRYEAGFGVGNPAGDAELACRLSALLVDDSRRTILDLQPFFLASMCPRVAAAVTRVPGAETWGARIHSLCTVLYTNVAPWLVKEPEDCLRVGLFVNGLLRNLTVFVIPFVTAEGIEIEQPVPASNPAVGPYDDFVATSAEDAPIVTSFSTAPGAPAPLVDYVATASLACVEAGTQVEVTVAGTDGYSNASTCTMPGTTGSCEVFVLGAPAGVVDAITVTTGDVERRIYVEF